MHNLHNLHPCTTPAHQFMSFAQLADTSHPVLDSIYLGVLQVTLMLSSPVARESAVPSVSSVFSLSLELVTSCSRQ